MCTLFLFRYFMVSGQQTFLMEESRPSLEASRLKSSPSLVPQRRRDLCLSWLMIGETSDIFLAFNVLFTGGSRYPFTALPLGDIGGLPFLMDLNSTESLIYMFIKFISLDLLKSPQVSSIDLLRAPSLAFSIIWAYSLRIFFCSSLRVLSFANYYFENYNIFVTSFSKNWSKYKIPLLEKLRFFSDLRQASRSFSRENSASTLIPVQMRHCSRLTISLSLVLILIQYAL